MLFKKRLLKHNNSPSERSDDGKSAEGRHTKQGLTFSMAECFNVGVGGWGGGDSENSLEITFC